MIETLIVSLLSASICAAFYLLVSRTICEPPGRGERKVR